MHLRRNLEFENWNFYIDKITKAPGKKFTIGEMKNRLGWMVVKRKRPNPSGFLLMKWVY